jgi:hypothetical protein
MKNTILSVLKSAKCPGFKSHDRQNESSDEKPLHSRDGNDRLVEHLLHIGERR